MVQERQKQRRQVIPVRLLARLQGPFVVSQVVVSQTYSLLQPNLSFMKAAICCVSMI